jgi:hypothetical protein
LVERFTSDDEAFTFRALGDDEPASSPVVLQLILPCTSAETTRTMKQSVVIATVVILMGSAAANRCVDPNACTGKCRELCNARTLAGMAEAAVSFKPGTNVEAIARRLFISDAFMAVVPVSAFEGGKLVGAAAAVASAGSPR